MQQKKSKANQFVNSVTNFTQMRFAPKKILNDKKLVKGAQLVQKIKNIFPWGSALTSTQSIDSAGHSNMVISKVSDQAPGHDNTQEYKQHQLRFCSRLTMEHIIIGNRNQLDVININQASRLYLDSEYLWSLSIDHPIDLLTTDTRKALIILGSKAQKKIWVFRFMPKKMSEKAYLISEVKLLSVPHQIYFLKDQLAVIYAEKIELFLINNEDEIMRKNSEAFNIDIGKQLKFFRTPQPLENFINIFFTEEEENKNIFTLWLLEIEVHGNNFTMKPIQKIYDIKKSLKKKLVLKSFSKETFLMNLGTQILAFKKGYMIDSVSISITANNSILKYIGDERLIHVSDKRIELYEFTLNTSTKPYRIKISPLDSISVRTPIDSKFLNVVEVFNKNIVIAFQIKPKMNRKTGGEVNYWLALTQPISLKEKIDMLFPIRKFLSMAHEDLEQHCDMARKMGLSNKEIFTELWNRSMKREDDFGLLISTRDYNSIRDEVIKLLKKNSLSFSEIYKLERSSLSMLKEDVFSPNCTQSIFFGYISSSFLKRKLEYFRDTCIMERTTGENEILMVSIKKFNEIKHLHIDTTLIDLLKDLCFENRPVQNQIRLFLNMFKFILRMVYKDLLVKIICVLEEKFIVLLQKIPEILPYDLTEEEKKIAMNHLPGFYQGIFGHLRDEEQHLSFDRIATVDNRQVISAAVKDLWFKRNFLSNHCFIVESNEKIEENFKWISSQSIFYFVIESILNSGIRNNDRKKLFSVLEKNYRTRLSHLQGRINLRYMIFSYLQMKRILPKDSSGANLTLRSFMSLDDDQLFAYLFEIERQRKGLLLSEIKPIYEESDEDGLKIFNESLLNYFKKPVSQLSDIKYLLNRINNEKKEFHTGHQDMYKILVQAMTYKMMIGTDNDIPLSEIIIYIQNVPLERNNEMFSKLTVIHEIDENMELLSNARINMSVKQIIENPQLVMTRLIDYLIVKEGLNSESTRVFEISYNILANLQFLHHALYKPDEETFYIFFIFLTKVCENASMINYGKELLNDQFLSKQFNYDPSAAQSLVIYLYKLKMSTKPTFDENESYLKKLLTLLPEDNEIREFIICEYEFAKLLTSQNYKVEYPLGSRHSTPGLSELEMILYNLTAEKILSVDVEKLYELMKRLQELNIKIYDNINSFEDEEKSIIYSSLVRASNGPSLSKKQVYEVLILCLLSMKKIQETIPYINRFLEEDPQESDIVYPYIFLAEIGSQLNHESRGYFFKLCAFYFQKPVNLFEIMKHFLLSPLNSKQKSLYLKGEVQKSQLIQKGFNIDNKLLNQNLIKIAIRDGLQEKLFANFFQSFIHLVNSRAEFEEIGYSFIFIILIHSPYVLAKYMLCSKRFLKIKSFRLILTYITKEKSFDSLNVLQFGYRLFLMVMFMLKQQATLETICDKYFTYPLSQQLPDTIQCNPIQGFQYFFRLQHSADAFKKERQLRAKSIEEEKDSSADREKKQQIEHRQKLLNPNLIGEQEPIEYSEVSSDSGQESVQDNFEIKTKKKNFDAQNQMKKVIEAGKRKKSWQVANDDEELDVFEEQNKGESSHHFSHQQFEGKYKHFQNPEDIAANPISEEYVIRVNPKDSQDESNQMLEIGSETGSLDKKKSQEKKQKSDSQHDKSEQKKDKSQLKREKELPKDKLQIGSQKNLKVKEIIRKSSLSVAADEEFADDVPDINFSDKRSLPEGFDKNSEMSNEYRIKHDLRLGSLDRANISIDKNDDRSPATPNKKILSVKKIELQESYPWFEGLPAVEDTGKQIYRSNLIEIQKSKKRIFKVKLLTKFQKHPDFEKYLFSVIEYIFNQSTASSLSGVIHLIEFVIDSFKLPINKKNLQIWTRAQNLQSKYDLDFAIRTLLPIKPLFEKNVTPQIIFTRSIHKVVEVLDEINVFKMSKLISLAFQVKQFEDEVIFSYFKKLLQSFQKGESDQFQYKQEKIAALIEKLSTEFISLRLDEILSTTSEEKRNFITTQLAEKMKKKAKRDEKIQFFTRLSQKDPSYANVLTNIMRI